MNKRFFSLASPDETSELSSATSSGVSNLVPSVPNTNGAKPTVPSRASKPQISPVRALPSVPTSGKAPPPAPPSPPPLVSKSYPGSPVKKVCFQKLTIQAVTKLRPYRKFSGFLELLRAYSSIFWVPYGFSSLLRV